LTGADLSGIKEFEGATFKGVNWWHARTGPDGQFKDYLREIYPKSF
jgi:hypothetical protein